MIKKLTIMILVSISIVSTIPTKVFATPPPTPIGWYKSWSKGLNLSTYRWEYFEKNATGYCTYVKGWKYIDGYWYYFNPGTRDTMEAEAGYDGGEMQIGWFKDNNKWYYCYYNGHMAHDCVIDHWILGSDGAWTGKVDDESLSKYNSRTYWGLCMADEEQTDVLYTNRDLNCNGHKITKRQLDKFKEERKVVEGTVTSQMRQGNGTDKIVTKVQYLNCYNPWEEYEPLKDQLSPNKIYVDSFLGEGYQVTVKQFEKFKAENRLGQTAYTESSPSGQTRQSQAYYLLW